MWDFISKIYAQTNQIVNYYLWGDIDSETLFTEIKEASQPIVKKKFGILGGTVAFIRPNEVDMARLMDAFDGQPYGRKDAGIEYLVKGLISIQANEDLKNTTREQHALLMNTLSKPVDFIKNTKETLHTFLDRQSELQQDIELSIPLVELASNPLRKAVGSHLFAIDDMPVDLQSALQEFSNLIQEKLLNFGKILSTKLMSTYYSWLFPFIGRYQQAKEHFEQASKNFLLAQVTIIVEQFKGLAVNPNGTANLSNIAAIFIAHQIEKEKQLKGTDLLAYFSIIVSFFVI